MANQAVNGFIPSSGGQNWVRVLRFYCDGSANSTNLTIGDVVAADSGGGVKAATAGITYTVGVIVGCFDVNGIPCGHPLGAVSTKYLTASVKGYVDVAIALPDVLFEGTADSGLNASGIAATDVFSGANILATACDTTTARSKMAIGAVGQTGAIKDLQIMGLRVDGQNTAGAVSTRAYVRFTASLFSYAPTTVFV